MLAILGDIHGNTEVLQKIITHLERETQPSALIQVGDWGWYPDRVKRFSEITYTIPTYWIDGNHECFPLLTDYTTVTEIFPNCFYVPRGTVLELDKKRIGFCGGAASVDKDMRIRYGMSWYPEEVITEDDMKHFEDVESLDLLITHTPPQSVIDNNFDRATLRYFGLNPDTWRDPSAHHIEDLWARLNYPPLVCGHMHKTVQDRTCRILDIDQVYLYT